MTDCGNQADIKSSNAQAHNRFMLSTDASLKSGISRWAEALAWGSVFMDSRLTEVTSPDYNTAPVATFRQTMHISHHHTFTVYRYPLFKDDS